MNDIFLCSDGPSFGFKGMPGEIILTIYKNGTITEAQYTFLSEKIMYERVLAENVEIANEVADVIRLNKAELKKLPDWVGNCLDGPIGKIVFEDITVNHLGINKYINIENLCEYYLIPEEEIQEMTFQNQIIDVYEEITQILKKYLPDIDMPIKYNTYGSGFKII